MEKPGTKYACIIGVMVIGVVAVMIAVIASVAVLRNRQQQLPQPEVQTMPMPSEVQVNAIEHKSVTIAGASGASASSAVSMICGESAAADRYEARNDALRRLTVAACGESANTIARISAIQLAGERGYRETLPMLRGILAGTRRDAVLDMAVVGSVGLMGDANDIQLLESFRSRAGRRLKPAIDAAVQRIKERAGAN